MAAKKKKTQKAYKPLVDYFHVEYQVRHPDESYPDEYALRFTFAPDAFPDPIVTISAACGESITLDKDQTAATIKILEMFLKS